MAMVDRSGLSTTGVKRSVEGGSEEAESGLAARRCEDAPGEEPDRRSIMLFGKVITVTNQQQNQQGIGANSSSSSRNRNGDSPEEKLLRCSYCFRGFENKQALGGHQNAHRREFKRLRSGQRSTQALVVAHSDQGKPLSLSIHRRGPSQLFPAAQAPQLQPVTTITTRTTAKNLSKFTL